jgi:hypothetical protein
MFGVIGQELRNTQIYTRTHKFILATIIKNKPTKFVISPFTSKTITMTKNTTNKINALPARSGAGKLCASKA